MSNKKMKTYNISNRLSKQAKSEIQRILNTHERYSNSYFFRPDTHAKGRRANEQRFITNNPDVTFVKNGTTIEVSMSYSESCKNVYYKLYVTQNGESKNVRLIKSLIK